MYTIGKLSKEFSLSRSALIYYDKIGLLSPTGRSENNYRRYSEADVERLRSIMKYRDIGISLEDIEKMLNVENNKVNQILTARLDVIQSEVNELKKQESAILAYLVQSVQSSTSTEFDRYSWKELLSNLGFTYSDSIKWHIDFEESDPKGHESFLIALGLTNQEIEQNRIMMQKAMFK